MSTDRDEVTEQALLILKEQVKERVRAFGRSPFGHLVKTAAQEVLAAQKEGRQLDEVDLARLCLRATEILKGRSGDG